MKKTADNASKKLKNLKVITKAKKGLIIVIEKKVVMQSIEVFASIIVSVLNNQSDKVD